MRQFSVLLLLSLSTLAGAAEQCWTPDPLGMRSAPAGTCAPPDVVADPPVDVCRGDQGSLAMVWDADLMPPGPRCLTAAELLGQRRAACTEASRTERSAVISADLLPDEQIIVRTEPTPQDYQERRQWWDWIISVHDAHVGDDGPIRSAAGAGDLTPCPGPGYLDFDTWRAQQ
jgi:hypothetical protein